MAVAIDRDLDLDVAVLVEPLLEVERVVAEGGLRLGAADAQHRLELARGADHAHALAAAAGRRLDQDRVADPLGLAERVQLVAQHAVGARDRRQAVAAEQLARPGLGGEALEDRRRRPDERQAVRGDDLGEALVLGQEAVARVDRVAAGDEGGRDHRRRGQIRAPRRRPGRCRWPRRRAGPASESRSASLYATTAWAPSVRQARRIRSAISPRFAIRTLRNTVRPPAQRSSELDEDQVLAVLDGLARVDEAGPTTPSGRRDDLLRDAEESTEPSRSPARTLVPARASAAAGTRRPPGGRGDPAVVAE